jgi:ribokinase
MDLLAKVPRLPRLGETLIGSHFHMGFGGKGANQAVMAAKLGAKVTMVTKLGRDMLGEATYKNYQDNGIGTGYISWSDAGSGVAPIFVDDEGNNFIVIVPGANFDLTPEDVREAESAISEADVVVCQLEVPHETTLEALRLAKRGGAVTLFNPAPGVPLSDEFFRLSDIIAPNEVEAGDMLGKRVETLDDAEEAVREFLRRGSRVGIVTLGERGAMVGDDSGVVHVPSLSVNAVDSTGAGDAFIGTMAYFIATGVPLLRTVRIANVAAAISVTRVGTQVSFPSREEIDQACAGAFKGER